MIRSLCNFLGIGLFLGMAACTGMEGGTGAKPPQTALAEKPHKYEEYDGPHYGALTEGMFAAGAGYNVLVPE